MKFQSSIVLIAIATALIAATPPPSPPPITAAPAVQAVTPTPQPIKTFTPLVTPAPVTSPGDNDIPTPPPDKRKGLTGVWEIQVQHPDTTVYEHFQLLQQGTALKGVYLDNDTKKKFPLTGTVDGTHVQVIVTLADGSTMLFVGKVDGTTDMLGLLTDAKDVSVPFTAAYRPKEKLLDNVSPDPTGGMMTQGSNTNGQLPPP